MEINKLAEYRKIPRKLRKFLVLFMIVIAPFLYAQNDSWAEQSVTIITKTDEGFVLSQVIVFPAVPNTIRYEVEIEQQTGEGYVLINKLETLENRFEVSLKAGNYRYRISSWNKMNLLEGQSDWQDFEVSLAVQPVIESYQPVYGLYYEMAKPDGSITVAGRDFSSESEFALVNHRRNFDWSGITLEGRDDVFFPDSVVVSENQAIIRYNRKKLKTGNYDILVRNPGGMWTTLGEVRVGQQQSVDLTFSFGWSPTFALFDIENALYLDSSGRTRLDRFNPVSFYLRAGFIPIKTRFGNFGLELQAGFLIDKESHKGEEFEIFGGFPFGTLNILYQLAVTERLQHNVRLGLGGGEPYHYNVYVDDFSLHFDFGYSAQFFIWKDLYAEAGIDLIYAHMINLNHGHFMIRPSIGIGWQFGRWADWAEVAEGAKKGEDYSVPVTDRPRAEHLVSLGWEPMIPLNGIDRFGWDGSVFPGQLSDTQFIYPFNPAGFNLRYAYLPYRWGNNKLGFEFELSILQYSNRSQLEDDVSRFFDLLSDVMLGIRYQRVINEKWRMNINAGVGFVNTYIYDYNAYSGGTLGSTNAWEPWGPALGFKLGASVQYFIWKNLYAEGGLGLTFTKVTENMNDGISGDLRLMLKPTIAIGWQFKRDNETGVRLPTR